jgi:hypothetical protein
MNKIRILNLHNCQNRNQEDLKQCYQLSLLSTINTHNETLTNETN